MVHRLCGASLIFLLSLSGGSLPAPGQIIYQKEGLSSGDMKKKIINSFLFKTTDIFYPPGTKQASDYPQITESGLKELETDLRQTLAVVTDLHARNAGSVSQLFNRTVPPSVQATVVITNLNQPIAQSYANEKGVLEIRIDVHVLQATFRGSLLSALQDASFYSRDRSSRLAAKDQKTDDQLLADFLDFKKQVLEAKARSLLGDVFHGGSLENDPWFRMSDLAERSGDVQMTYVGTLMFLMAHEVGHHVLGHDPSRCELFSTQELEADKYAGYLQGALLAPQSAIDEMFANFFSMLDSSHSSKLAGFLTFFDDAYGRVGFVDPSQTQCHLAYPEPKLRLETAQAAREAAIDRYKELLAKEPAAAQQTTPMKIPVSQPIEADRKRLADAKAAAGRDPVAMLNLGSMYYSGNGVTKDYREARRWFEKAAKSGNAAAMFALGHMYHEGEGVALDYQQARQWLEKAAVAGDANGMSSLGYMYYRGEGVGRDYQQARQWYEKAAAAGDTEAMSSVGQMYHDGEGGIQDYQKARQWFEKAAAAGETSTMRALGRMYYRGEGSPQDCQQARKWFEKAAAAGDADAMGLLGVTYYEGTSAPPDYQLARQWFEKAAAAGYAPAMSLLGVMYYEGKGVKQDYHEALQWSYKAAAGGSTASMYMLGSMYEEGEGVAQDYQQAGQWFQKAAEAGDVDAMNELASLYSYGKGLKQDYQQARHWCEKAASKGDPEAMHTLGRLYAEGHGVPQSYELAQQWYEKSASAGNSGAQVSLGYLYEYGRGVQQDYERAREWYEKAATAGNTTAMYNLGSLYEHGKGTARDHQLARQWYQKAADGGNANAVNRLTQLPK